MFATSGLSVYIPNDTMDHERVYNPVGKCRVGPQLARNDRLIFGKLESLSPILSRLASLYLVEQANSRSLLD